MFSKPKQQTAAIYVRVSTEEQAREGYSIPAQIETLTQYCKLYQINIYKIYKDLGISGKNVISRPGLNELLLDASKGFFDCVLVWKISRLSRNLKDLLILVDKLEQSSVAFISYSEKFDTSNPVGRMTLQILGSIAEFERNTLIENVKLGLNQKALQGHWTGNHVLGYDNLNKKLAINHHEAKIVQRIYRLFQEGNGAFKIADILNKEGYRTKRNALFGKDYIHRVLTNPVYKGWVRHQVKSGENYFEVKGVHDPIIEEESFETVQNKLKNRSLRLPKNPNDFILSGLLRCPKCNNTMVSRYGYNKGKTKKYRYYICGNYHRYGSVSCKGNPVNSEKIEQAVIEKLGKLVANQNIIKNICLKQKELTMKDTKPILESLANIENELTKLNGLREKYFKLFEADNLIPEQFTARLSEIQQQIDVLEFRRKELSRKNKTSCAGIQEEYISNYLKGFSGIIQHMDPLDLKKILHDLITQVNLSEEKELKSIDLRFPLSKGILTIF
ncbi:MAG: recombinase family protein [Clostridia bacterium]|nr:recombinase family protein [Clostridia bacterium]